MKTPKMFINDIPVAVLPNQTILEAALTADIYIPHLCSHPDLLPQGGCKLCVVEVDGNKDVPVTSCTTLAKDSMKVVTKSPVIDKLRSLSMELILAGHPSDCTSCRSYGNCELQSMMQYLSVTGVRMRVVHHTTNNINTNNPLIDREMERCIQCGRCVRVCHDLRGVGILDYKKKDGESYIGTPENVSLADADCRFCGACIEVCPTGALQDRDGIFRKDIPREQALIPCKAECPGHIDIPEYIRFIKEGKYSEAVAVIREKAPFPHALGYVCTHPCEKGCKRTDLNQAIAIRDLKRFAAENDNLQLWRKKSTIKSETKKRVAIIGSGPCGLTAAYYLKKAGHEVTIFERHNIAGGMMATGIPSYRLPTSVLENEVKTILETGIKIEFGTDIENVNDLKSKGYDAVLVAVGASAGKKVPLPGSDLGYSTTAVEFLRDVALGNQHSMVKKDTTVTVLGGGNVAFDAARVSRRLGATVNVICLESREHMLADFEEIQQGEEEGVQVFDGKSTLSIEGSKENVTGIKIIDVSHFHFEEGKLVIETIPNTEALIQTDVIIFATGQKIDFSSKFGLELNKFGYPLYNAPKRSTSKSGIFLAGDVVTGTKTVIDAIVDGREAASEIDSYLGGSGDISEILLDRPHPDPSIGKVESFAQKDRSMTRILSATLREGNFSQVDAGFTEADALHEADRCLQCDLRNQIQKVKLWNSYKYK